MFTQEDLEDLVPPKIFARGVTYYEDGAVGRVQRKGNTFKAKVEGTETYRVELTAHAAGQLEIYCDCPYDHGDVCKHGIALSLAVLDLVDEVEALKEAAAGPPAKLTKEEQRHRILSGAWARTSDKEKIGFLGQLLAKKPKLLRKFLAAFEFDEAILAAAALPAKPKPGPPAVPRARSPRPVLVPVAAPRRAAPRRAPTLSEQAQKLLDEQRGPELLPLLLALDWLREPPAWDTATLPRLLAQAANYQPEATLDAVMERFEAYVENPALRAPALFNRLSACLRAVAGMPALAPQAKLFASELLRQYPRLLLLRQSLGSAGFVPILPGPEASQLPKQRARKPKPAAEVAGILPPKRRGWPHKNTNR